MESFELEEEVDLDAAVAREVAEVEALTGAGEGHLLLLFFLATALPVITKSVLLTLFSPL